jgi:hypothetical protein
MTSADQLTGTRLQLHNGFRLPDEVQSMYRQNDTPIILSEPPTRRLCSIQAAKWVSSNLRRFYSGLYDLPIPHVVYALREFRGMERYVLDHVWFSPVPLTTSPEVSAPPLPNVYNTGHVKPCGAAGRPHETVTQAIDTFWQSSFLYYVDAPTPTPLDDIDVWENLQVDEVLALDWPQNIQLVRTP